jgi:RND family efflux transporter MFP subunit
MSREDVKVMKRSTTIIALCLAAGAPVACGGSDPTPEATARAPIAVTVFPVTAVGAAERLEAGGVVAAQESATLSSRTVATIATVRARAGDRVRAGDVLVTLDASDVTEQTRQAQASALAAEQSLAQARTEERAAEAEHRLATTWHDRIAALHKRNSSTDQERDEAEARLASAAARLAGARASIDAADARVASSRAAVGVATANESFTTVRAPFDGLVTERLVDPGTLATPGVPLLRIESDGARQVVARVDEARAAYVQPGDRVSVVIDALERRDPDDSGLEGIVAEVARAVGADQRAFTVKVTVPGNVTARSGSFARVVFRGAPRRALLVPANAIRRHGQITSVFVVQEGTARLRLIQVGESSPQGVEVLAGLDAGESIVTAPLERLVDGARVTIGGAAPGIGGSL